MDVPADLSKFFDTPIIRFDVSMLKKYNPRKFPVIQSMIDRMGKLSSEAQRLKRTLTTYEKLMDSTDDQFLYILWEPGNRPNQSVVVGLLKVGYKGLYLYNRSVRAYNVKPLCVLDFFIHSSKQRQGYGHRLFDYMLEQENVAASAVAIDKPSESLLAFLAKHYGLTNPIWQNTNFVVYPQFFQIIDAEKDSLNGRDQVKSPDSDTFEKGDGIGIFAHSHSTPNWNRRVESVSSALPISPIAGPAGIIARASSASVSNATMAKGRKIVALDHQHLW